MKPLSAPQRDVLVALYEKGAEGHFVSLHGLTRGNRSGNKLTHALSRGSHGSACAALKRRGLVESKFSAQAGVELWRLSEAGVEVAKRLLASRELSAPLVFSPRSRVSSLAERRALLAWG